MLAPTEFRLKNIRTFLGEHTLRLHPHLTVIVGTNNAGKSSLLLAIHAVSRNRYGATLPGLARHGSTPDAALAFPVPFAALESANPDIRANANSTSGGIFPSSDDVDFFVEERGTRRCQLVGSSGNGIEYSEGGVSQYCDADFLERLFAAELEKGGQAPPQDLREQVCAAVASLGTMKGDQVLYGLFASLLGEDERKAAQLARVTRFLLDSEGADYTKKVWEHLAPTMDLLDALSSMAD